jgi:glycosyltransferase involved in cell wall biosynthesis
MRILVCFKTYLRPGDPGVRRFNEFCNIWAEDPANEVTVIAGQFSHHLGARYADLRSEEAHWETDGPVRVLRLASTDSYHKGFKGRAWSQYWWGRHANRRLAELDAPDVVIASSPTLWASFPMVAAKKRWNIPAILEIRDLWPEAIIQHGIAGPKNFAMWYLRRLERYATSQADHAVTIVETQKNSLVERGLMQPEQITVIPNGIMLDKYEAVPSEARERLRAKLGIDAGRVVVLYVGGIGRSHDVGKFVDLAGALREDARIQLVCVGDGPDRPALEAEAVARGLGNLLFTGAVPTEAVPEYCSIADIGCALVNTGEGTNWDNKTRGIFRNAFFDLAGAHLPVVFNVPGFPVDEIQDRAGGGIFCDTSAGIRPMAQLVAELAADPERRRKLGENNYREVAVRYNRRKMAQEYMVLLKRLVGQQRYAPSTAQAEATP